MKLTENEITSTITCTVEITDFPILFADDYTEEEMENYYLDGIQGIFPCADIHIKNLKVFEGTEGGHE